MSKNRRSFLGAIGAAAIAGLAGCTGVTTDLVAMAGLANPEVRESWSTINESVAVMGQPTIEDGVPQAWGAIARTPEEADALIDWNAIRHTPDDRDMTPSSLRDFLGDIEEHFVTVLVGVLPGDESLKGAHNGTSFEGNVMRSEVTSYKSITTSDSASEDTTPEEEDQGSKYHYDYSFALWARNGVQTPDSIEVTYHE